MEICAEGTQGRVMWPLEEGEGAVKERCSAKNIRSRCVAATIVCLAGWDVLVL